MNDWTHYLVSKAGERVLSADSDGFVGTRVSYEDGRGPVMRDVHEVDLRALLDWCERVAANIRRDMAVGRDEEVKRGIVEAATAREVEYLAQALPKHADGTPTTSISLLNLIPRWRRLVLPKTTVQVKLLAANENLCDALWMSSESRPQMKRDAQAIHRIRRNEQLCLTHADFAHLWVRAERKTCFIYILTELAETIDEGTMNAINREVRHG